jgi:hypothetical protein
MCPLYSDVVALEFSDDGVFAISSSGVLQAIMVNTITMINRLTVAFFMKITFFVILSLSICDCNIHHFQEQGK